MRWSADPLESGGSTADNANAQARTKLDITMQWGSSSSSSGDKVTVEFLTRRRVALDWQEAVAIVLETAEVMERTRRRSTPARHNIVLTPAGAIEFLRGRTQSGPAVSALAQTLGDLLPKEHPTQLRLILSTAGPNSSSYKNVGEFADALKYFERPGRRNMIGEVYARALETPMPVEAPVESEVVKKPKRKARPGRLGRVLAPLAGFAAVFAVIGAGAWFVEFRNPGSLSVPAEQLQEQATAAWGVVRESAEEDLASLVERVQQFGTDLHEEGEPEADAAAASDGQRPSTVADLARAVPPATPPTQQPAASAGAVATAAPAVVTNASTTLGPDPLLTAVVFDTTDVNVMPPVTLNRRFPPIPAGRYETRRNNEGLVEAVVSATGEVETVKLLYPPNTVHESMILSAIKTWQFQPAVKDGRPVRYRQLIPVTVP